MTFAGEFLGLPGLRGYWPMNAFDGIGNAIDQSGQGRTLTYNGNPKYSVTSQGGPYLDLDGTGDYLSRASESALAITGTESYVIAASNGLTLGGWFWTDVTPASFNGMITKSNLATQRSIELYLNSSRQVVIQMTDDGATLDAQATNTTTVPTTGQWFFAAGRFVPSASLDVYVNSSKVSDTSSIPASIFNCTTAFNIGAFNGASLWDGRIGLCFLCAMALSDTAIDTIYDNTKASYGL